MDAKKVIKRDDTYVMHTYARSPIALAHGHGLQVWDANGKAYLDFTSGIGVNVLGFTDAGWVAAVTAQLNTLQHSSNLYYTAPCGKLAKKLCHRTGLDKVFFGNSGAEANEGAIKAARKYSVTTYGPRRCKVLTLCNSFHGRTLATLTATGQDAFHHDFGPFPGEFAYVPANDLAALTAALDDTVCAVMMEMVQGEGGVMALEADYAHAVAALCAEKDVLLIVDEVQTGVGRTGTFLAAQHYGLQPDIVTLAKGLGGGLPIGAVLTTNKVADTMGHGSHGSTFGGNPVICAGACAVLDKLDDAFMENVNACAHTLREGLATLPHVAAVSGLGLMVGIQLADGLQAAAVRTACEQAGLLVLTAKDRLRLLPPLCLSQAEVAQALQILGEVLAGMPVAE
ncbi:MAG: acetylornithine/succinylornithine family transaminase [Gemmiger sp.]|nr:acetylornithine/succinylornithine family transaminase [Gemmiger sp.]